MTGVSSAGFEKRNEYQRRHYAAKSAWVTAYKAERGCAHCGERDVRCLDLHHIDGATKNERLRYRGKGNRYGIMKLAWQEIYEEVLKCEVLCANCHRKEHR